MIVRVVLILMGLLAVGAGCGQSEPADDRVSVAAAFYPLAYAAEQIGGDQVEVQNLTPPGAEPHDVELSARDVEQIRSADIVLYLGGGFQPAVEQAVRGAKGKTIDLLDERTADPHIWLDPIRYAAIVQRIGRALGHPVKSRNVARHLHALDFRYLHDLVKCDRREIVTSHAAFGHLARKYGLRQIALTGLAPEAEPTARDLEELVTEVERTGATTVFVEPLVSPRLAETVAREAGVDTAVLNPLEGLTEEELDADEDYFSVMRKNLKSLRKALGCL